MFDIEMEILHQVSLQDYVRSKLFQGTVEVLKDKNRYFNVLPYDNDTRVTLGDNKSVSPADAKNYINASHILSQNCGLNARVDYIATQAPVAKSVTDFWNMVWEQDTRIILMLTDFQETRAASKVDKAMLYWSEKINDPYPSKPDQKETRPLTITQIKPPKEAKHITRTEDYALRWFTVERGGMKRSIVHMQFLSWPDHGIPEKFRDYFEIYRFEREALLKSVSPGVKPKVLLHCSAGIGRTGTFAAIDMIWDGIEAASANRNQYQINVFEVVRKLRTCRPGMVQTKSQYQFISTFLLSYLQSKKYIHSGLEEKKE